jgi:D-alanine-D-alanine ligase
MYTLPPEAVEAGRKNWEFDLSEAVRSIAYVLPGAAVAGIRGEPREVLDILSRHQPDVVFNACEAPQGRPDREAHVVALLEWLGVAFTGSGSETLALCRRKDYVDAVLSDCGIPVPRKNTFPCIVKPAAEDGSVGIHDHSVCENADALTRARSLVDGPVVVQEFLEGREFAVSLWGHPEPHWESIGEIRFSGGLRLTTYSAKWDPGSADFARSPMVYDKDLDPALRIEIATSARKVWRSVGARGYVRVDMRLNAAGVPCVLDVNPNPDLSPGAGINRAVIEAGWSWEQFIRKQIEWASSSASF